MEKRLLSLNLNIYQRTPTETFNKEKPSDCNVLKQNLFACQKGMQSFVIFLLSVFYLANSLEYLKSVNVLEVLVVYLLHDYFPATQKRRVLVNGVIILKLLKGF